jgi:hypothetical protein
MIVVNFINHLQGEYMQTNKPVIRKSLLGFDTNSKTVKGQTLGFYTGILYLAPSDISGFQVCPMAKLAQCENACLYSAGRGAFTSIQNARIAKTQYFFNDRQNFMLNLVLDIQKGIKQAKKQDLTLLIRLNGTSDIKWENVYFDYEFMHGKIRSITIFDLFPEVQFYDYTKIANRIDIPKNYDLTFSYSGVVTFQKYVKKAIDNKMRIATVFRRVEDIPTEFLGLPVVSGDNSDIRHLDKPNSIVGLYAKGKAKKDTSGFVVDII